MLQSCVLCMVISSFQRLQDVKGNKLKDSASWDQLKLMYSEVRNVKLEQCFLLFTEPEFVCFFFFFFSKFTTHKVHQLSDYSSIKGYVHPFT